MERYLCLNGIKIGVVEVSFISHATEDSEKMLNRIEERLSVSKEAFDVSLAQGHFGNPILIYKASMKGRYGEGVLKYLLGKIRESQYQELKRTLAEHLDKKGCLLLRLEKQVMAEGNVVLSTSGGIVVKARPRFRPSDKELEESYLKLLQEMVE